MSEYKLTQEILARSVGKSWILARTEWTLHEIYESDVPQTCLCGHFPIIEICTLLNRNNGIVADVGNCCVKKFIGLPSDKIFSAVKRVRKDPKKSLNEEAISHAYVKGWITEWEKNFYMDIMRKRSLTAKQRAKKIQINESFSAKMQKSPSAGG